MATLKEIETAAKQAAAAHAFDYTGNSGRGSFRHEVAVRVLCNGEVQLRSATNARVSADEAKRVLVAVRSDIVAALGGVANTSKIGRDGYWHMSRFSTTHLCASVRAVASDAVSADEFHRMRLLGCSVDLSAQVSA